MFELSQPILPVVIQFLDRLKYIVPLHFSEVFYLLDSLCQVSYLCLYFTPISILHLTESGCLRHEIGLRGRSRHLIYIHSLHQSVNLALKFKEFLLRSLLIVLFEQSLVETLESIIYLLELAFNSLDLIRQLLVIHRWSQLRTLETRTLLK